MNPPPKPNDSKPVWELVIEDMHARDQFGRSKYHTPLQMGNGRNHAQDAYEEVLDLAVYMKQVIIERAELRSEVERLRAENETLKSNFEKLATAVDGIKELHPSKYTNDDVNKLLWSCVEVFRTLGKIREPIPTTAKQ